MFDDKDINITGSLTPEEVDMYKNRECNSCNELIDDRVANFGYCKKYYIWNPTKCPEARSSYGCTFCNRGIIKKDLCKIYCCEECWEKHKDGDGAMIKKARRQLLDELRKFIDECPKKKIFNAFHFIAIDNLTFFISEEYDKES